MAGSPRTVSTSLMGSPTQTKTEWDGEGGGSWVIWVVRSSHRVVDRDRETSGGVPRGDPVTVTVSSDPTLPGWCRRTFTW